MTCHSTISASATPSPTSGMQDRARAHRQPSIALTSARPTRVGAGEIVPFLGMRIGRVPAGDALDRRLERIEAALLHLRRELGAEARGQRRLVHDHAAAGLLDRGDDRVDVERDQRAQVDDLGVDAGLLGRGLRDMHHRAVAEHRHRLALAPHRRLAERHDVVALRHFARADASTTGPTGWSGWPENGPL